MEFHSNAPADAASDDLHINATNQPVTNGLKRNERLVYAALLKSDKPLKAYDLLDELHDQGLRAPMTIYRALESLAALGRVRKIESLNAFLPVQIEASAAFSAFIICRNCTRVREVALDDKQAAKLFAPVMMATDDIRIEAFSDCLHDCTPRLDGD